MIEDRRVRKTKQAIKNAFIQLLNKKDLEFAASYNFSFMFPILPFL